MNATRNHELRHALSLSVALGLAIALQAGPPAQANNAFLSFGSDAVATSGPASVESPSDPRQVARQRAHSTGSGPFDPTSGDLPINLRRGVE